MPRGLFPASLDCYELPEGGLAFAAHNVVYERRIRAFADLFCGQRGMVAAENRLCACLLGNRCQRQGLLVLKAHGGQAHQIVAVYDLASHIPCGFSGRGCPPHEPCIDHPHAPPGKPDRDWARGRCGQSRAELRERIAAIPSSLALIHFQQPKAGIPVELIGPADVGGNLLHSVPAAVAIGIAPNPGRGA